MIPPSAFRHYVTATKGHYFLGANKVVINMSTVAENIFTLRQKFKCETACKIPDKYYANFMDVFIFKRSVKEMNVSNGNIFTADCQSSALYILFFAIKLRFCRLRIWEHKSGNFISWRNCSEKILYLIAFHCAILLYLPIPTITCSVAYKITILWIIGAFNKALYPETQKQFFSDHTYEILKPVF